MIEALGLGRKVVDVPCTIEIEHTWESLHAHVDLEGITVEPGDEVHVQGGEIVVPYGEPHTIGGTQPADLTSIADLLDPLPWENLPVLRLGGGLDAGDDLHDSSFVATLTVPASTRPRISSAE